MGSYCVHCCNHVRWEPSGPVGVAEATPHIVRLSTFFRFPATEVAAVAVAQTLRGML